MGETEIRYLKSLAKQYPTIASAATEIINLKAILSLPKGTEHFITDVHGEYEQFQHIMRNGSGAVKLKIEQEFGTTFSKAEKKNIDIARKSIVALRDIKKGEVFSVDNIVPRHAGHGIEASQWYNVLGKKAKRDFIEDEMIEI